MLYRCMEYISEVGCRNYSKINGKGFSRLAFRLNWKFRGLLQEGNAKGDDK